MVIIPDSKVKLIKNPLKLDSNNEITFSSKTAQYNYFNSLPKLEFDNLTYIRKEGVLRIETNDNLTFEDLLQYNFCMYQNTHFDTKWFYAFITDIKWINPSLTEISLETAYYQTWQFDLVYMDSFIEREHVNDDTIGLHTLPEDLELGDPIQTMNPYNFSIFTEHWICIGMTEIPPAFQHINTNRIYNGIYSGLTYMVFKTSTDASNWILACDEAGRGEAIDSMFMIPKELCPNSSFIQGTMGSYSFEFTWIENSNSEITLASLIQVTRPVTLAYTYTPKNNKLYTFPYSYMTLTNNAGTDVVLRYEDFRDRNVNFKVIGSISAGCSIKCIPLNYKRAYDGTNTTYSFNFGVNAGKFPICSWNSDVYTNWLTQQGANISISHLTNELGIIGNGITGNWSGVASNVKNITGIMLEKYEHSFTPNQAKGNTNSGDVTFSSGNLKFTIYYMSIRKEYAESIDSYFKMFGYKVNRLGKPHIKARTYYDYIKTIGINLEGNIPENDLIEIRKMFDNGIRFWHSTQYYLDFSVNNTIVS